MGLRPAPRPAFAVPDEETWLSWGENLRERGWAAGLDPGRADVLIGPEELPAALHDSVAEAWMRMPVHRELRTLASPFAGERLEDVLRHAGDPRGEHGDEGEHDHGGQDEHGDHQHGGHGDMMAITGDPSADGLVMETMSAEAGPLGVALPTGVVVSATLDGDVVAECTVHGALPGRDPGRSSLGRDELAWLHRFARLLGWRELGERARAVVRLVTDGRLPEAGEATEALHRWLEGSGALRRRTQGLAPISTDDAVRAMRSSGGEQRIAENAGARRAVAGEVAVGLEWSAALVAIASVDPSPWEAGG